MDNFDSGFNNMMSSAIEYERLKSKGEPIPDELKWRMEQAGSWIRDLSDSEYSRLIH